MYLPVIALPVFAMTVSALLTATPLGVVKNADAEIDKILQGKDATVEKLAARADDFIDFVELAKRALGSEWAKINKKQQDDFSSTMKGVLRASYAKRALADGRGGAKIQYGDEKTEGNEASVATTLQMKDDSVPVIYKLYRPGAAAEWKIYDVVTDDVSLVATYSDQFKQLISKKGFDGLLKSLKARREQLEKKE